MWVACPFIDVNGKTDTAATSVTQWGVRQLAFLLTLTPLAGRGSAVHRLVISRQSVARRAERKCCGGASRRGGLVGDRCATEHAGAASMLWRFCAWRREMIAAVYTIIGARQKRPGGRNKSGAPHYGAPRIVRVSA